MSPQQKSICGRARPAPCQTRSRVSHAHFSSTEPTFQLMPRFFEQQPGHALSSVRHRTPGRGGDATETRQRRGGGCSCVFRLCVASPSEVRGVSGNTHTDQTSTEPGNQPIRGDRTHPDDLRRDASVRCERSGGGDAQSCRALALS